MSEPARHPTLQVLAGAEVRAYLAAQFASSLAHSLLHATLAWHMWKLTGSYAFLGWLGAIEFVPVIPASLLAGAVSDAVDRRRILLTTSSLALLVCGVLAVASRGAAPEVAVLACAFVLAIVFAFQGPAASALLPALVPRLSFPSATVINANVRNLGRVSGPVLMGVVTRAADIPAAYATAAVLYLAALLSLVFLAARPPAHDRPRVTWASVREGIAFVRSRPPILGSMALDMFAVIFAGATAMLPVYADQILHVGEVGYGVLSASMQAGTLLMAAILLVRPPIERPGRALLWAVSLFGLSTIVFGLSRTFGLSVAAFVVAGMADQVSMTTRSIIVQLSTPDSLRGRVSSVNMIFIGASNELGAAESGFLAALTGAVFSVVFGGIACLGVGAVVFATVPSLRAFRIDDREPARPA